MESSSSKLTNFGSIDIRALLSNVVRLNSSAIRASGMTRTSFVHQRHSYSRLELNEQMFNALMSDFRIFPRFKDFVLLFGSKRGDNEIGVPQLRFRRLLDRVVRPGEPQHSGFGTDFFS